MSVARQIERTFAAVFIFLVRLYQLFLSPLKQALMGPGGGCRFRPTCSAYAIECLRSLPLHRALRLSAWRILRCNPWGGTGYDPAPKAAYREAGDESGRRGLSDLIEAESGGSKTEVVAKGESGGLAPPR